MHSNKSTQERDTTALTELRGFCQLELADAIDAIAQARGVDRNTFFVSVMEAEVKRITREAVVLHRTMRGNQYMNEAQDGGEE